MMHKLIEAFLNRPLPFIVIISSMTFLLLMFIEFVKLHYRLRRYIANEIFPKPTAYDKVTSNGEK